MEMYEPWYLALGITPDHFYTVFHPPKHGVQLMKFKGYSLRRAAKVAIEDLGGRGGVICQVRMLIKPDVHSGITYEF
jgi:hypothetical protein